MSDLWRLCSRHLPRRAGLAASPIAADCSGTASLQANIWRTSSTATWSNDGVLKKTVAGVALSGVAVTLAACGPSYPDGPKKDAFINGVAAFCGEDNYVVEDRSGRPLGGPTALGLRGNCISQPTEPSNFMERLQMAFPGSDIVEFEGGSFEVDNTPLSSGGSLDTVRVYDSPDPEYDGPRFTTGYRLNDAS